MAIVDIISKLRASERITAAEALELWNNAPLWQLSEVAVAAKRRISGDKVYYNRNFHLEPTNVCQFECKFCSYRRSEGEEGSWDYTMEQVLDIVRKRKDSGATEIHIVGGVHPTHDLYYYTQMIRRIKQIMPQVAIKAFTAVELNYMISKAGLTTVEGLQLLKDAGMESIPGGGAEIFAPEIRNEICPQKGSAEQWLALHRAAHKLGIDTNATMLYGHIESIEHRIDHLMRLRELQDETGGINAFIPLKFRSANNSLSHLGETSVTDDLRTLAMSRLILDNVAHIKAYWVMYGKTTTELALAFGADDIDGTIDDSTKIYSMAGADDARPTMSVDDIVRICSNAGFRAVERDTHYNEI
ncbi:MAG: aminofutalosine synthase MqnE [Rikenellaceae bacterium]|nr:aminofutalosine synthase MqnE [Rikenellaceae bacterium]